MTKRKKMRPRLILSVLPAAFLIFLGPACGKDSGQGVIKVGVIAPLNGSSIGVWSESLEWARENIELAGGISSGKIQLVYSENPDEDSLAIAKRFADDSSIVAAIGPDTSGDFFDAAELFIKKKKVIISPSATSAEIFSAYGGKKYVWRTVQSDIAQLKTMLLQGLKSGYKKIALISSTDKYGTTFDDTFGFFTNDLGLKATAIVQYDQSLSVCAAPVAEALAGAPEILFIIPSTPEAAVCIVKEARALSPSTRLFLSDGGRFPQVIEQLGALAEGLEGTSLSADPQSGFEIASMVILGHAQAAYAASTYDALLLIAYGLERSGGRGGEALADAITEVVDARGVKAGWDEDGIRKALGAIRSGELPDITGASGPLDYDLVMHTDPIVSIYGHWRVEAGQFLELDYVTTGDSTRASSLARSYASERAKQEIHIWDPTRYTPAARTGLWAFIAATSKGWNNYRHQADALSQYQLLKSRGVPDSRIILVLADDLAYDPINPEPGVIRNVAGGPNVYADAQIDYKLSEINANDLMDILAGRKSDRLRNVIESTAGDDLYVYIIDHGNVNQGVIVGKNRAKIAPLAQPTSSITPNLLSDTAAAMFASGKYRRMMAVIETCNAGVMGVPYSEIVEGMPEGFCRKFDDNLGLLLLTGARADESSYAYNYDSNDKIWRADRFSWEYLQSITASPWIAVGSLYSDLYGKVPLSHVSVYNYCNFGDVQNISMEDFITP